MSLQPPSLLLLNEDLPGLDEYATGAVTPFRYSCARPKCAVAARGRCADCLEPYCSAGCQSVDWSRHCTDCQRDRLPPLEGNARRSGRSFAPVEVISCGGVLLDCAFRIGMLTHSVITASAVAAIKAGPRAAEADIELTSETVDINDFFQVGSHRGVPVIRLSFEGSTLAGKPVLTRHDFAIVPGNPGKKIFGRWHLMIAGFFNFQHLLGLPSTVKKDSVEPAEIGGREWVDAAIKAVAVSARAANDIRRSWGFSVSSIVGITQAFLLGITPGDRTDEFPHVALLEGQTLTDVYAAVEPALRKDPRFIPAAGPHKQNLTLSIFADEVDAEKASFALRMARQSDDAVGWPAASVQQELVPVGGARVTEVRPLAAPLHAAPAAVPPAVVSVPKWLNCIEAYLIENRLPLALEFFGRVGIPNRSRAPGDLSASQIISSDARFVIEKLTSADGRPDVAFVRLSSPPPPRSKPVVARFNAPVLTAEWLDALQAYLRRNPTTPLHFDSIGTVGLPPRNKDKDPRKLVDIVATDPRFTVLMIGRPPLPAVILKSSKAQKKTEPPSEKASSLAAEPPQTWDRARGPNSDAGGATPASAGTGSPRDTDSLTVAAMASPVESPRAFTLLQRPNSATLASADNAGTSQVAGGVRSNSGSNKLDAAPVPSGVGAPSFTDFFRSAVKIEDARPAVAIGFAGATSFHESSTLLGFVDAAPVYLDTAEPFVFTTFGVSGAGKSHTLNCVLESCLLPFPEECIIRINQPQAALVFHFDQSPQSLCEAVGLARSDGSLCRLLGPQSPRRCLSKECAIILVSPAFFRQRVVFYGNSEAGNVTVKPFMFAWKSLTADHVKRMMLRDDYATTAPPPYISTLLGLLRRYQRAGALPDFPAFLQSVGDACDIKGLGAPLRQRLRLLEAFVAESAENSHMLNSEDISSTVAPGKLVILDLTDPLLSSMDASVVFDVALDHFRNTPLRCGKVLALDGAYKFMSAGDKLAQSILNAARNIRRENLRLLVSTHSPASLAQELCELATVAVIHRYSLQAWHAHLSNALPLPDDSFKTIAGLLPGEGLLFASRALKLPIETLSLSLLPREPELCAAFLGKINIRRRVTADRGVSRVVNKADFGVPRLAPSSVGQVVHGTAGAAVARGDESTDELPLPPLPSTLGDVLIPL